MDQWTFAISIISGVLVIIALMDKIGVLSKLKKIDNDYRELQDLLKDFESSSVNLATLAEIQQNQNLALLAMLRDHLYRSFRDNRSNAAWSDDECRVQTNLHEAYKSLNGNGEEAIWWSQKLTWRVVSQEELDEMNRFKK